MAAFAAVVLGSASAPAQCDPQELAKLLPDYDAEGDNFGYSVAISGTTAIVGAHYDDDNGLSSGSAYLFDITTGLQVAKLLANDGAEGDRLGESVAISGDTAIVGALTDSNDNGDYSGSAYLFDTTTGRQIAKLLPGDGAQNDSFGTSVAISAETAIVGALNHADNGCMSGSAYFFDISDPKNPFQIAKLLPDDGAASDHFGISVAISDATAIVGASGNDDNGGSSGSAYLFETTTGRHNAKLLPNDGAVGDSFGASVAISGETAIVGAFQDNDNGNDSGSAYLFDISDPKNPFQIAKLLPSDGAADDWFGHRVDISSTTAIVGARYDDDNGSSSGSAYLFDISDPKNPVEIAKLLPDDGAAFDFFGFSVAIGAGTAIVGAYGDDDNGSGSGSAYVFDLACPTDCEGDANGDGLVDPLDSGFVLARFGCAVGAGDPMCDTADMNGDGLVDPLDLGFILARFGECP